jgi:hypothetical protein
MKSELLPTAVVNISKSEMKKENFSKKHCPIRAVCGELSVKEGSGGALLLVEEKQKKKRNQ